MGRTIVDHASTQVITGEQALALVRARHVAGDPTADLGRIGRQQQVLRAMLAQATSRDLVSDPARLNAALQSIIDNSMTDNVTLSRTCSTWHCPSRGTARRRCTSTPCRPCRTSGPTACRAADTMSSYLDALLTDQPLPSADS